MTAPIYAIDPETLLIETREARNAADPYAATYQAGKPYNHICIDNFLPEEVLRHVQRELASLPEPETSFDLPQEKLKTSYIPERLPTYTRSLFYALNSRPFLQFLERLTGIPHLIPDPYFLGAGIHKVANGGHLDIHADFNHHSVMDVERRLNVLIYLNDDWREEYGGSFEVWDKEMTTKLESYPPLFNRMLCFSTSSDSFHGNPEPVNHPDGTPRMSIALYYYTATWGDRRVAHTTLFRPRPGSEDKAMPKMSVRGIARDILPPIVYRALLGGSQNRHS